jgi:lipopolysaccharide/colanic/teichoic acid biosynthesis glycosyltransferase
MRSWISSPNMAGDAGRRALDIAVSTLGLVMISPVLAAIALLVKVDSPGPVLYVAQRVGACGRLFRLYKFRTMSVGADKTGPGITTAGDARITRVGRVLRRTKLDELPQLMNVAKGDMSLIGPRPEDPRYVQLYTAAQREVLKVRPGLTGAASLAYRDEAALLTGPDWEQRYINEIMPRKLSIELDYLARRTLVRDLELAVRTLLLMPPSTLK